MFRNLKKKIIRILKPKWFLFNNQPISQLYGLDRGEAIDRFFIEKFLENNKDIVTGKCLELLNNDYTNKYGHDVSVSDILDIDSNNKNATIHGDIKNLEQIPDNQYDCIILTQVLQFIDDYESAIKECHRILKNGGVILVTVPSVSRIDCASGTEGDYWRFTEASAKYIFGKFFALENITVTSHGNAVIGAKFLLGFSQEEVSKEQLNYNDLNFPLIITVRACKKN